LIEPIEDAVSVTTASCSKELKAKVLFTVGLGIDRCNLDSDAG
jgi:hypothetical protein